MCYEGIHVLMVHSFATLFILDVRHLSKHMLNYESLTAARIKHIHKHLDKHKNVKRL